VTCVHAANVEVGLDSNNGSSCFSVKSASNTIVASIDSTGRIRTQTVESLSVLLLNELKKQKKINENLETRLKAIEDKLGK